MVQRARPVASGSADGARHRFGICRPSARRDRSGPGVPDAWFMARSGGVGIDDPDFGSGAPGRAAELDVPAILQHAVE